MILVIGFSREEVERIKGVFEEVYEVPPYCRDWVLQEIIEKAPSLEGSGDWHDRKFFIMHGRENHEVKEALSRMKELGFRGVIYATTTPTSLKWPLEKLIQEWLEEDAYFRKMRRMRQGPYLDIDI